MYALIVATLARYFQKQELSDSSVECLRVKGRRRQMSHREVQRGRRCFKFLVRTTEKSAKLAAFRASRLILLNCKYFNVQVGLY